VELNGVVGDDSSSAVTLFFLLAPLPNPGLAAPHKEKFHGGGFLPVPGAVL
jgi:hypothetical protein